MLAYAEDLYDHTSAVGVLNKMNFAKRVTNNRKKGIKIVHFYSVDDGVSADHKKELEKFNKDNKGMFEILAINCDSHTDICEKEGVTSYPTYVIYPPYPMPTVTVKKEGYSLNKLIKKASKLLENKVIEITSVNHDTFIKDNPGKAKVLLFTENEGIPSMYKALAYNFDKTLFFGIVRSSESSLAKKYKVKSFPSIFLVKPGEEPLKFQKEKLNYYNLADFINIYSEIFDFGDATTKDVVSAATKPWLSVRFPELTKESSGDLCFDKKGLCVILLTTDKPTEEQEEIMINVREKFVSNLADRGLKFSFMWLDTTLQAEWPKTLETDDSTKAVVLNPGKRKRYMHLNEELTEESLTNLLNSITGGNGRFRKVEGNALPNLKNRE